MTLAQTLADLQTSIAQVDTLISNAHRLDNAGGMLFPAMDRLQITTAAFLNMFIAWESFLESAITKIMSGEPTISGNRPNRYVSPPSIEAAQSMIVGINRYFDYANIEYIKKIVSQYFENGYPFEPHLSGITRDIADLRTMRNASAHLSISTQTPLEGLAQRLLMTPQPGISLYQLLTSQLPNATAGRTVLAEYRDKLLTAAQLIAQG